MAVEPWRLADALEWGSKHLKEQGIEMPRIEAQLFLSHVLNRGWDYIYLNPGELLSTESLSSFRNLVKRREEHIPWQYLIGHTEFMSLDFVVNEGVMIPRPETELLVEAALERLSTINCQLLTALDMGTGCGNIAIALAKALPCQVYALDISEVALRVARVNAKRLNVEEAITFLPGDIFALSGPECLPVTREKAAPGPGFIPGDLEGKADLMISNPPYVAAGELNRLQPEVSRFEPRVALDGGKDGLKFYLPLIEEAKIFLHPGGYLVLEMGINQAEAVQQIIVEKNQFHYPEIIKDYSGVERVIIAQKR